MNSGTKKSLLMASLIVLGQVAHAQLSGTQGDWTGCIDPKNTKPYSTPYGQEIQETTLFRAIAGTVGTVTYGSATGPCFGTGVTANVRGRLGFGIGSIGSIQSTLDDFMPLTFGFPNPGADWSYECLQLDGALSVFGSSALNIAYFGASDRYFVLDSTNSKIDIHLRVDVIADAARAHWTFTNTDTKAHSVGLWVGMRPAYIDSAGSLTGGITPLQGGQQKNEYIIVPGEKPITTEKRFPQDAQNGQVPPYANFDFGQTEAYGLQVVNGPAASNEDQAGLNSDATQVDEFAVGQAFFLLGAATAGGDTTFPDVMFGTNNNGGDVPIGGDEGFIQKYNQTAVGAGGTRDIISYYRTTSMVSNYSTPYSVAVDAPNLMPASSTDPTGLVQPTGGYDIRVYVDNARGFSTVDQSIELDNVKVTLNLPQGINMAAGDTNIKTIQRILPSNQNPASPTLQFVDFHVAPDGVSFGQLPYSVTVEPTPGPIKTLNGTINVPTTAKLVIHQGPNLVSTPFTFVDSSWEKVLGLTTPTDFTAYTYDPVQNGYIPSQSAARGKSAWIVSNSELGVRSLQSTPTEPTDLSTGASNIQIQPGWNLIGNPYDYAFPLGQIVGVSQANPSQSYTFAQLVSLGYLNPALAQFSVATGAYTYIQQLTDLIQPNTGYWIFNATAGAITLNYPPVFQEFLPGSTRAASASVWPQTDSQWRLQIAARANGNLDSENYIGFVPSQKLQSTLEIMKPPASPLKTGVDLSIEGTVAGKPTRLATALGTVASSQSYLVDVVAKQDGDVTLTWPNLGTLPKDVQVRLIDKATGITRSINQTSGYTFTARAGTTRQFSVQVQSGVQSAPAIGNVIVTRPSRDVNAPFTISYTLAGSATTEVRVLSAAGNEVYTITSGRADAAGQNSVTWNLRDNANRSVAPGVYRVEITATTANGERVRKITSLNVTR